MAVDYDALIDQAARAEDVDPRLMKTILMIESSGGRNNVASLPNDPDSPIGPAQMRPSTARAMRVGDPRDPAQAITGMARYLREGLEATGSPQGAAAYYFAGPDRAGWGPKTAAYAAKAEQLYPTMQIKAAAAAPAARGTNPDLAAGLAELEATPTAPAPARAASSKEDDLKTGLAELEAAQPTAVAAAKPELKVDPAQMGPLASDVANEVLDNTRKADAAKPVDTRIREALAPDPNTTYGGVLPLAKDNATGALRPALPSSLRDMAQGVYDLSQGPATGTVTPEGTNALAGLVMGGMGASVARGTGAAVSNRLLPMGDAALGRAETPDLLGQSLRANPFAPEFANGNRLLSAAGQEAAPAGPQPGMGGPQPGMGGGAPAPNSVGAAATPGEMTNMTPREAAVHQARGENFRLANPRPHAEGGQPDKTEYIPGVQPTVPEVTGNADMARRLKAISQEPGQADKFRAQVKANNDARVDYLQETAGDPVILDHMREARSAQADRDTAAAFTNKKPTDASPVVMKMQDILDSPQAGERDAVKDVLLPVMKQLQDDSGALKTDPERLYGIRKNIDDMLAKRNGEVADSVRLARQQLLNVRDVLDDVIENGAPGFAKFRANYAEASRPIDSMELLQKAVPSLMNGADRTITFDKFDRLMKTVVAQRQTPGINQAKSLNDETMERLWNLHADLHRQQQAVNAAKVAGSDTYSLFRQMGALAGEGILHIGAAAATAGNPIANMAVRGAVSSGRNFLRQRKLEGEANRLLDGSNYKP